MNKLLNQILYRIIWFIRETFYSTEKQKLDKKLKNNENSFFDLLKIHLSNSFKTIFNYLFKRFIYYYNMRHLSKGNYISSIKKFIVVIIIIKLKFFF